MIIIATKRPSKALISSNVVLLRINLLRKKRSPAKITAAQSSPFYNENSVAPQLKLSWTICTTEWKQTPWSFLSCLKRPPMTVKDFNLRLKVSWKAHARRENHVAKLRSRTFKPRYPPWAINFQIQSVRTPILQKISVGHWTIHKEMDPSPSKYSSRKDLGRFSIAHQGL